MPPSSVERNVGNEIFLFRDRFQHSIANVSRLVVHALIIWERAAGNHAL